MFDLSIYYLTLTICKMSIRFELCVGTILCGQNNNSSIRTLEDKFPMTPSLTAFALALLYVAIN